MFVGLGNPGLKYRKTRHNTGFMFVDEVSKNIGFDFLTDKKFKGEVAITNINNEKVIFLKPSTYMNLSGESVRLVKEYYDVKAQDIYIIHDDMDLPAGKIRLRARGSSGGHNGIKSIIESLKTEEFCRIKIGIDKDEKIDVVDYVLGKFSKDDDIAIQIAIAKASDIVKMIVENGFEKAMNEYN